MLLSRKLHIDLSFHTGIWANRSSIGFGLFIKHIPFEGHLGGGSVRFEPVSSPPCLLDIYMVPPVAIIPSEERMAQHPVWKLKVEKAVLSRFLAFTMQTSACVFPSNRIY